MIKFTLFLVLGIITNSFAQTPIDSSFSYQGELLQNDNPANGEFDFQFELFNHVSNSDQSSGVVLIEDILVNDGLVYSLLN